MKEDASRGRGDFSVQVNSKPHPHIGSGTEFGNGVVGVDVPEGKHKGKRKRSSLSEGSDVEFDHKKYTKQKEETKKLGREDLKQPEIKLVTQQTKQEVRSELGLITDAPEGHVAFKKARYCAHNQCVVFQFPVDGKKVHFQTTVKACGDCRETAERIARLCYLKFETGTPKEEVIQYRDELYKLAAKETGVPPPPSLESKKKNNLEGSKNPKKQKGSEKAIAAQEKKIIHEGPKISKSMLKDSEVEVVRQLRHEHRLQGALCVQGRNADKKNRMLCGIYALLEDTVDGASAYEKYQAGDAKRFLYYSSAKKRWKISDVLGDTKGGFAFIRVTDGGQSPPVGIGDNMYWSVYDGPEVGYNVDRDIRCTRFPPTTARTANGALGLKSKSEDGDTDESGSSESSDSSESVSDTDSDSTAVVIAPELGATQGPVELPSKLRTPSMVCAKMLVRSNLRCACHFMHMRDCPSNTRSM